MLYTADRTSRRPQAAGRAMAGSVRGRGQHGRARRNRH
jgi:hypothetical protein